jgi:quinohemoprotein ethanol dehydrogenase
MRTINWLILVLVLALAATIYWFGFHQPELELTEVVVVENGVPASASAPAPATLGQVDDSRVANAPADDGNWLTHGRTFDEQRFSPLTQINRDTVSGLGLAWFRDMGTNRTLEATPIVVDGVMFFSGAWSRVYAMSADDGEMLWSFDPKVSGEWGRRTCCDVINRGVAVYRGKVYVGALDGRLIALAANSGEQLWTADTIIDRERDYSITGAPRVANGKVFIGNGGAEYGVRGYASAYDAESGELLWRFFTVPGDPSQPFEHPEMELAAGTWSGGPWWEHGGGGTVWNSIVYDAEFDQVYLGTGNGAPWSHALRSPVGGDNLFLASIVAVDASSGRMNWYYQEVPAENWDYTATQDMALAEMKVDGALRKVLLQAPKNGFFYVLDRADGKLLRAHPFATVNWASHVDLETGRPVLNPDIDYLEKAQWVLPGPLGAHNWQAMSVDVEAGLVYLPTHDIPFLYTMPEGWQKTGLYQRRTGQWNLGVELERIGARIVENIGSAPASRGYLKAFDPLSGEARWTVELPHYWNGGVLASQGGLVFQGDAQGYLSAYDKDSGAVLWQFNTYTSILAAPVTYAVDGVQYLAILTGTGGGDLFGPGAIDAGETLASGKYGNAGRMLVFKLGGTEQLPLPTLRDRSIPEQVLTAVPDEDLASGERLYFQNCAACHGFAARAAGAGIPDLRQMSSATHDEFAAIVLGGSRMSNGMASFANVLTAGQAEQVHQYIRARAFEDREQLLGNKEAARLTWQQSMHE